MNTAGEYQESLILLISDDLVNAKVWEFCIQQAGHGIQLTQMGLQALDAAAEFLPDILAVDSYAKQEQEIAFCRALRTDTIAPLLLFTDHQDEETLLSAYQAGVDDVVVKPISPRIFIAKINAWLRHAKLIPAATVDQVTVGNFILNEETRQLTLPDSQTVRLSYLEARLMYILMTHPNQTQATDRLIRQVWGSYNYGDSVLLKNLVYRLRHKLEPNPNAPVYLLTDGNKGYYFSG